MAGSIPALSAMRLPAVGRIITRPMLIPMVERYGHAFVAKAIRDEIGYLCSDAGVDVSDIELICRRVAARIESLAAPSIVRVLNATGVVLHTNLGRAPLGRSTAERIAEIAAGYSNLEFDLNRGRRGDRQARLRELLSIITGAEDSLAVNNNAAAVLLVLKRLAARKEVIVSRGELIEIGDSFRLPEIMRESGAKLVEVGTTNRTRISDYERAISDRTAILFKVHHSNFRMEGFVEDAPIGSLSKLARERGLIAVYDLGSGLLARPEGLPLKDEPTVRDAIEAGADLVTFSGDKLLGGAQAGLIAGRRELVAKLAKSPLMRALRPGKLTMVAIEDLALQYLDGARLLQENPVFRMIGRGADDLRAVAESFAARLQKADIAVRIVESDGQVGGGALPGTLLPGWAVEIEPPVDGTRAAKRYAEALFAALLKAKPPVLGILREGRFMLDVRTLDGEDIEIAASAAIAAVRVVSEP
ncbi:MAG: L-seryl-tRNA(Sec) selenium transferase [Pseudomonadota bacterium]